MEYSPLTWRERAQLWLRLGLRGALALGGAALFVFVGLPLASLLSPFLFALVLVIRDVRRVYRFAKVKIPEKVDETMEKRKEKRLEKAFEKKAGGDS